MNNKIIEISNLKKYYGAVKAVDGIDFYVEAGTLFAFLGPNGAGKSTTIDIICTLLKPDSGTIIINGKTISKDDNEIRKEIGIVFQDNMLDNLLTVRENLIARGSFYGLKGKDLKAAVNSAAEAVGVTEFIDRPYGKLSGGQRRRADIARAFINKPNILFLDEPTTGLDPKTRKNVWNTISKLQKETGMTVFLTTHYMEEAANADYVAVIDQGKIIAKGTPSELREKYSNDRIIITPVNLNETEEILKSKGLTYTVEAGKITVILKKTTDSISIIKALEKQISMFEVMSGSMDDAFIAITKNIKEE